MNSSECTVPPILAGRRPIPPRSDGRRRCCCYRNRAQMRRAPSQSAHDDENRSRCPGGVPSSPWCLTGSGGPSCHTGACAPCRRPMRLRTKVTLFFGLIALIATVIVDRRDVRLRPLLAARAAHRARPPAGRAATPSGSATSCAAASDGLRRRSSAPSAPSRGGFAAVVLERRRAGQHRHPVLVRELPRPSSARPSTSACRACSASSSATSHYVGVGIHIAEVDANYFEAFQLGPTERTLRTILLALVIGSADHGRCWPSGVGWWTSRRLLRPLGRITDAAGEIAAGDLDTAGRPRGRPRPRPARRLVQRHGRRRPGPHRARGPLRLRRQPRAALPDHRAGRRRRGHRRPPRRAPRPHPAGARRRRRPGPPLRRHGHRPPRAVAHRRRGHRPPHRGGRHRRRCAGASPPATASPTCRSTSPAPASASNGAPPTAVVDQLRFERILANLLENAAHHGGGPLRISIEPTDGPFLLVAVEDAGPGVARGERVRIFERFARGSAARHRIGTGLGLALVAEHATAQGGEAWVEDRPGGGARFVVRLPDEVRPMRRLRRRRRRRRRSCSSSSPASCSVGGDSQLQQIDSDDLFGLDETTTSTTTTTTTVPTTVAADRRRSSRRSARRRRPIATESVELYFLDGSHLAAGARRPGRGPSRRRGSSPPC